MANVLKRDKQELIIKCLADGSSIRATERITDVHRDTIMRLMVRVGQGCAKLMDDEMRWLTGTRFECDEIWTFVGKKQRRLRTGDNESILGDQWIYVAIDADTKLIPSYKIGKRTAETTQAFIRDLAERCENRIQISTDGMIQYITAIEETFGRDVDYGQIVKSYEADPIGPGRYAPPRVSSVEKFRIVGKPKDELISTAYAERQNLTMRLCMNRLTRLSLGFSKKVENLEAATALHFANYNFCRKHGTLAKKIAPGVTPAMAAEITDYPWSIAELMDVALGA